MAGWAVMLTALAYLCGLFAIAHFGDTLGQRVIGARLRPFIYALSLGIYCTSWTFFGSVGLASVRGLDFLPIYIGPILVFCFGHRFIRKILRLAKEQNITSVADFVAARFGKAEPVAALVSLIAVIGGVPYIALQLKAVASALTTMEGSFGLGRVVSAPASQGGISLGIALILAGFAMAFGTRRVDATEHQDGLILAVAMESIVKIVAFLIVGAFVTWGMFGGLGDLAQRAVATDRIRHMLAARPDPGTWATMILLSACACIMLPRQFHVTIVENRDERDLTWAAWLFPAYLIIINLFVLPIAIAGLLTFPDLSIDRDLTVVALPLQAGADGIALLALIGGLSAASAMVIVASVAIAIMVSNDLVMPLILRARILAHGDMGRMILTIRRLAIIGLLLIGHLYYRVSTDSGLAAFGLLSFGAIAQIAPSLVLGLVWTRANSRGALAGLAVGFVVWVYTLLLPSLDATWLPIGDFIDKGPLGIGLLRPTALFATTMPPLTHGVVWSLSLNTLAFVALSLSRRPSPIERLQANIFVGRQPAQTAPSFRLWRASVPAAELEATVARYLGPEPTRRAFESFRRERGLSAIEKAEADIHQLRFAEHLLASAIGAASSRLVLSLLLRRRNVTRKVALKLLDNASAAIQYNRDLLQHALDHARQGITVFDRDLRLVCWNREFRDLFNLPGEMLRVGIGLEEIIRCNAERGMYGAGPVDAHIASRLDSLVNDTDPVRLRLMPSGVIEIRSARMPDGGLVTTYTDVTDAVEAEEALEATNETLERRVHERTEELVRLNVALAQAKAAADDANLSKTRFLAAASHDILQPLNAARLYATSLVERTGTTGRNEGVGEQAQLARNVDASLEAVEDILTALLDISRLDAGAMKPEFSQFSLAEVFDQLKLEFEPQARKKRLSLRFVATAAAVRSDRRLLQRLLQNLVSNAIKYTAQGRVVVGCRRSGAHLRIEVWDSGPGIPAAQQQLVFQEFLRLDQGARTAPGLGLGLSIVERISRVLDQKLDLRSVVGRGSVFSVEVERSDAPAARTPGRPSRAEVLAKPLAGMRVLVVDNEARVRDGMQTLLAGWGCSVQLATDLTDALAVAPPQPPNAVLADYHLDRENGLDLVVALRRHYGQTTPAILITADRSPEVREAAAARDVPVLDKPLRPAALRALLTQWHGMRLAAE